MFVGHDVTLSAMEDGLSTPGAHNGRKIAFVHNFATHYTARLFEILARRLDVDLYFTSAGDEWWWPQEHGVRAGAFTFRQPRALKFGRFRFAPSLATDLWRGRYDLYIKSISGRLELLVTYVVARLRRKPFILWTGLWFRVDTTFHRFIFPFLRHIYRNSDAIVVYGAHTKRYLVDEGVDAERVFIARHSVDNAFYSEAVPAEEIDRMRTSLGISPETDVVLFVGRLEEVKGLPYLLEAFAQLSANALLLVVGDGSLRGELEARAMQLGIAGSTRFVGYVSIEDLPRYYAIATVTVLPSVATPRVKELWGLVVNESFNQGVPVIATRSVGAAAGGLVVDGETGFIVEERRPDELAKALDQVLSDRSLRDRLGTSARARVADWNHEAMADAFCDAIDFVQDEALRCPYCRGPTRSHWARLQAIHCESCGLIVKKRGRVPDGLDELYQRSWQDPESNVAETGGTDAALAQRYAALLAASLGRKDLSGLRLLDFGSGRGEFPIALTELGASVIAVDPYGAPFLADRGLSAHADVASIPGDERFDGVTTLDVVEHLERPWEDLATLAARLKPGGWIFVATPNPKSALARLSGSRWREGRKAAHLLFLPESTLRTMLRRIGATKIERLAWPVRYHSNPLRNALQVGLRRLRLDGEVRLLAYFDGER